MPPCHGGDRRFESGRARQSKKAILAIAFLLWPDSTDTNLEKPVQMTAWPLNFAAKRLYPEAEQRLAARPEGIIRSGLY